MPMPTPDESRLAESMYERSVEGLGRDAAPPWMALASNDRDGWLDLARLALGAAEDLLADRMLDAEGNLRDELEGRWQRSFDALTAERNELRRLCLQRGIELPERKG